jgi:hypothetical protein
MLRAAQGSLRKVCPGASPHWTKACPCWHSPGGDFRAQHSCAATHCSFHFDGHLEQRARRLFLDEARRVSKSMLIIDAAQLENVPPEEYQERVLNDGSRHVVYKRYFTPESLIAEIGTGQVLHAGRWFVAVLA